jgi:hypothetical protein
MTKVAVRRGKPDIFPPTYCLNCALASASPHQKPFAAGRWSLEPGCGVCATSEQRRVSRHGIFFGSGRENNAVPARVDLYKFYLCVCAGCSAVAMVVTSVSNGEKCLFAESVAAAVRVLVSQRPNDQL